MAAFLRADALNVSRDEAIAAYGRFVAWLVLHAFGDVVEADRAPGVVSILECRIFGSHDSNSDNS